MKPIASIPALSPPTVRSPVLFAVGLGVVCAIYVFALGCANPDFVSDFDQCGQARGRSGRDVSWGKLVGNGTLWICYVMVLRQPNEEALSPMVARFLPRSIPAPGS